LEQLTINSIEHKQLQDLNTQVMKKAICASDKSKEKLQAIEIILTQISNSSVNQQCKRESHKRILEKDSCL